MSAAEAVYAANDATAAPSMPTAGTKTISRPTVITTPRSSAVLVARGRLQPFSPAFRTRPTLRATAATNKILVEGRAPLYLAPNIA